MEENPKILLDQINRNTKELESFLMLNSRLKLSLQETIQGFSSGYEEKLKYYYSMLKDCLKNIDINCLNFDKIQHSTQQRYRNECTKEEFNKVFEDKNNEVYESLMKQELNYKQFFTISFIKPLLDLGKDEVIREILKEDYNMMISNSCTRIMNLYKTNLPQPSERVNDLPKEIIEQFNKRFNPNIQIVMDENSSKPNNIITITVNNSFVIIIKISSEFHNGFKMTVSAFDDYDTFKISWNRKERTYHHMLKKITCEDKSKYKVMRKIHLMMEDRLFIFLRHGKLAFRYSFSFFIHWVSTFHDIFKKKCNLCKQCAKLNLQDKCFYPPIYKFMDLDSDLVYHEECYNYINNSNI